LRALQHLAASTDSPNGGALTVSQNVRSLSTRFFGGLPAMSAELMAPIEIPATQSGCKLASAKA
jgi:hypothetical protein